MTGKNYRVIAERGLNIRSGPGRDFADLGDLALGEEVISPDTSGWLPVLLQDGTVGWLIQDFLQEISASQEPPGEAEEVDSGEAAPAAGGSNFSTKEETIQSIIAACRVQGLTLPEQIAYVLATVEWETGRTFKPVKEAYWKSEAWRQANLRYFPFYGRGYVQLTWEANYRKYSQVSGKDLVGNPDLALDPQTALFILIHGFKTGAFTGKKITDYINSEGVDFFNARRCINGVDKAEEIAALAEKHLETLP
jgi:predicted chitinase